MSKGRPQVRMNLPMKMHRKHQLGDKDMFWGESHLLVKRELIFPPRIANTLSSKAHHQVGTMDTCSFDVAHTKSENGNYMKIDQASCPFPPLE